MTDTLSLESHLFADDGETPNHPELPLVVMRGSGAAAQDDPASWFEERFTANDWRSTWRWHVYPYHHFHSSNHEVLGVARGRARLLLGGRNGRQFAVEIGDVIVIPAGVGHKSLEATDDFLVVGAYPRGDEPDLIRSGECDPEAVRSCIGAVPLPGRDPIDGPDGPLLQLWRKGLEGDAGK